MDKVDNSLSTRQNMGKRDVDISWCEESLTTKYRHYPHSSTDIHRCSHRNMGLFASPCLYNGARYARNADRPPFMITGMEHEAMISPETRAFVVVHRNEDVRELALKSKHVDGLDLPQALNQIAGWQIARNKLPEWADCDDIIYPPHISMEQCSSQFTAQYKAEIVNRLLCTDDGADNARDSAHSDDIGKTDIAGITEAEHAEEWDSVTTSAGNADLSMVDLTGGFGVDFSYLARGFTRAAYVERQPHLCDLAAHNMIVLGLHQTEIICGDGVEYLRSMQAVSLIYIDPARRDEHGIRTYAIEDCMPNVLALRDLLLAKARFAMIKLSPMLDWRKAIADFGGAVSEVHIVSTGNECKELLMVLDGAVETRHPTDDVRAPHVYCVNDSQRIDYDSAVYARGLRIGTAPLPEMEYLYEPNASIMKAGCFDLLEERYGVTQIGPNSHLFVAAEPVTDFPGRGFAIEAVGGMGKKDVRRLLSGVGRANVAVRNFPLTAPQLRKKLKLADGGDTYLFGTTIQGGGHILLRTVKV